jgi:hypothetical protein
MTQLPTDLPSSTEYDFGHGHHEHGHNHDHHVDEHVPVTTVMAPSEPENVPVSQAPDIAPTLLPQHEGENDTVRLQGAEGNSTEMTENPHMHFQEIPGSVHVIYDDDTTHPEHATYSPAGDHELHDEELGSTLSPHLHKETHTLVVNVANGNSSQVTEIPQKMSPHENFMTEFPHEMVSQHKANESNVTLSSQGPGSFTMHDQNVVDTSTNHSKMFSLSNEVHAEVGGIITTDTPVTSDQKEHHTVIPFGEHAENEADPTNYPSGMEKKGGSPHSVYESRTEELKNSTGKTLDMGASFENSAEEPSFTNHYIEMENEAESISSKAPAADAPVRNTHDNDTLRTGHVNIMLTPNMDSVTEMMQGSNDGMATVPLTETPDREDHRHAGLLFNDVYFSGVENADNETLNALSPDDYEKHVLQPVTVASNVHSPDLKKSPRLDDDEIFRINSNEEHDHVLTGDPTVESVPVVVHVSESVALSSAVPVTDRSSEQLVTSVKERFPSVLDDNLHPNITSATDVPEQRNATSETANRTEDDSVEVSMLPVAVGSTTESVAMETTLKPDKTDLSQLLKGSDEQLPLDDMLMASVSHSTSEGMVTVTATPVDTTEISIPGLKTNFTVFGTEIPDIKPDQVSADNTEKDVEMTTVSESDLFTTSKSNLTSSILLHDSSKSNESNSLSSGENAIDEGGQLDPGLFTTTVEYEVDRPLTVAPVPEHHNNETVILRNLHEDADTYSGLENNEMIIGSEHLFEINTQMESVDATTKSTLNNAENSSASAADSFTPQSGIQALTTNSSLALLSESSSEPNYITTAFPHEENDISSADTNGKKQKTDIDIPENRKLPAPPPNSDVLTSTVQNVTKDEQANLSAEHKDSATTTDSTDKTEKDDVVNNVTVSEKISSPILHVSSDEVGTSSTSPHMLVDPQGAKMNKTDEVVTTTSSTTETPLESDNEAEDVDLHVLPSKLKEHVNTVRPLPHNVSSTHSDQGTITESIVLGSAGNLVTGVTDHSSTALEKPHEFTDIENKLLAEPGKIRDVSMSSTPEYANDIHALPPSGGANFIPPTAQSVVLLDPITDEIHNPTSLDQLKNETLPMTTTESHSTVGHDQKGGYSTTPKSDNDLLAVSISKLEPKKKDLLNGSINKKPQKSVIGETSSLHEENEQIIPNKSAVNLYEKKPVDKLQKFDKDSGKKIDKMGFVASPVGRDIVDVVEDVNVTTAAKEMYSASSSSRTSAVPHAGANSTTETEDTESRPVDEEDENEDPLIDVRGDIEHINVVEPHSLVTKEKKADLEGSKTYTFEGETVMNENITMTDYEHVLSGSSIVDKADKVKSHTESSIAFGIEPAISRRANETSLQAEAPLTPRELPANENMAPQDTRHTSESSSATSSESTVSVPELPTDEPLLNSDNQHDTLKVLDVNVKDNAVLASTSKIPVLPSMTTASSAVISDSAGNSSVMNLSLGILLATPHEVSDADVPTAAPHLEMSTGMAVETSSKSPGALVSTVVTLSDDYATLHKGATMTTENGHAQNSAKGPNVTVATEDTAPVAHNNGAIQRWTSENGTTVGEFAVGETPMAFSKCASG